MNVERVHEDEGTSTSKTTRGHVSEEPHEVAILLLEREMASFEHVHLLAANQVLDGVLEGEVERLDWEVAGNAGEISTPQGTEILNSNTAGRSATIQSLNEP